MQQTADFAVQFDLDISPGVLDTIVFLFEA